MEKVAVIFNPTAGKAKLTQLKDKILRELEGGFQDVSFYETKQSGDAAIFVKQVAKKVDLIIAAGGDGTVNEVINAIAPLETRPAFAIIPGGTSNDFSREIGMLQNPIKAVEQIKKKNTKMIDIGQSDNDYFLNFWGVGIITQVSETVDADSKQNIGRLAYYLRTLQTIGEVKSFQLKIETDNDSWEDEAVMLIIGNGTYTGGIRAFFPQGSIHDGLLDVLVIKEASLPIFWSMLQSKVDNKMQENEGIRAFQTKEITIHTNPKQTIDCDGERKNMTPTAIGVLPGHIQMIVGEIK